MSRRAADQAITDGRVQVNGQPVTAGQQITDADVVTLDGTKLAAAAELQTIMLNKPAGYVVSREGQGSDTIYDLLPPALHHLKPVGRLDKYSSGLLLLTNDGALAEKLAHPRYQKIKVYEVELAAALTPEDRQKIEKTGVMLEDGLSTFQLEPLGQDHANRKWKITMHEGRNRQIRRTFTAIGNHVAKLHRTQFGDYSLPSHLQPRAFEVLR